MSQNLVSKLTLRIEQENKMMQEHQIQVDSFQNKTKNMLKNSELELQSLQKSAQHTTSTVMDLAQQAQESMTLVQSESKNLAHSLQAQAQATTDLCSQQMQQLQQLNAQSAQWSNISQDIFKTA